MSVWIEPELARQEKKKLQKYRGPWIFGYVSALLDTWKPKTREEFLRRYCESGLDREIRIGKLPETIQRILQDPEASPGASRALHYGHRDFNFMYGRTLLYFRGICGNDAAVDWFLWHGLAGAWNHYAGGRHGLDS